MFLNIHTNTKMYRKDVSVTLFKKSFRGGNNCGTGVFVKKKKN